MTAFAFRCPECRAQLESVALTSGAGWVCRSCSGVAVNLAVVRQHAPQDVVRLLWMRTRESGKSSARLCPSCSKSLRTFDLEEIEPGLELDGCALCQLLWFDASELERAGVRLPSRSGDKTVGPPVALLTWTAQDAAKIRTVSELVKFLMADVGWPR